MKINVDQIQEKPVSLHLDEPIESFPVLSQMQTAGECTFLGPVVGDLNVAREFDHIRLTGQVKTAVSMDCSRCLATYQTEIASSFTIIFRKASSVEETGQEEEVELTEHDLVSSLYTGNEIDMTHEVEEQISMEVPLKPLCSEQCKGLCSSCGTDLNQGTCNCTAEAKTSKFSALKDFKVNR